MLSNTKEKEKNIQSEPNEITSVFGFLIYNIFFKFGGRYIFQQIIGRTLKKQSANLSLSMFPFTLMRQSIYNNLSDKRITEAKDFNFTFGHLRIDRSFCQVHEEITHSVAVYARVCTTQTLVSIHGKIDYQCMHLIVVSIHGKMHCQSIFPQIETRACGVQPD